MRPSTAAVPFRLYSDTHTTLVKLVAADLEVGRSHTACPNRPENWSQMRRLATTPLVSGDLVPFGFGLHVAITAVPWLAVVTDVPGAPGSPAKPTPLNVTVHAPEPPLITALA